jgi:uncharacterized phiE125 gp8 family phage protein
MTDAPRIVLVTGTTFEPVSLQELKLWLKVDEGDVLDDGVISSVNTAARQRIESEVRRSMLTQTFDQVMDDAPCEEYVELERSPLIGITSIKSYSDTDLTDTGGTAMSSSQYYVDTASDPGRVVPFNSYTWPTSTRRVNGFIVRFTAGYSSGSSGVPEQLKTATKALAAYWYERRGDEALDDATTKQRPLPTHVKALLEDFDLPEWG